MLLHPIFLLTAAWLAFDCLITYCGPWYLLAYLSIRRKDRLETLENESRESRKDDGPEAESSSAAGGKSIISEWERSGKNWSLCEWPEEERPQQGLGL